MILQRFPFILFVVPITVAGIGQLLFRNFSSEKLEVLTAFDRIILQTGAIVPAPDAALAAQGYLFAATVLALAVTFLTTVGVSIGLIRQEHADRPREFWGYVGLATGASLLVIISMTSLGCGTSTIDMLGKDVLKLTLDPYWATTGIHLSLDRWVDVTNVLGISGAVFIAVCVCAIAPRALGKPEIPADANTFAERRALAAFEAEIDRMADDLEARTRWLKYLLFGAAAVLISAIANMQAWRGWPVPALEAIDPRTAKAYEGLANATTQYHAFLFVLVLVAIFLPMAMWLRRNARILSETAQGSGLIRDKTPADWRQDKGLSLSFSEGMQRVVAVISPLLIGPLLELVKVGIAAGG